jgi:hypothetical protein
MAKRFPLDIIISATDKASAVLNRVSDRVAKFYAPFEALRKSFGMFAEKTGLAGVGSALQNVGSEVLALGRKIALGFGVAAIAVGGFAYKQAMAADEIGDTANRLNITTDALQAYTYGFGQADVNQESFIASLDTLNKNLGDAKIGLGRATPLFRGLALDPRKFKTIDQLLPALADRLSRITDPAKRAAIAQRLLGDSGATMALKLAEGPKALREMMDAARGAGAIIGGGVIRSADKFTNTLAGLKATFAGVAGNAIGQLYPALIKLAQGIQAAIVKHQPQIEAFAEQFAKNLPTYIDRTINAVQGLAAALEPLVKLVGFMVDNFGAGNTVLIALSATIGAKLIGALFGLGSALVSLGVSMSVAFGLPALIVAGVAAVVAAGWWLYKNWDKVSMAIGDSIDWVVEKFTNAWENIKAVHVAAFNWIADKIKSLYKSTGLEWIADKVSSLAGSSSSATTGGAYLGPLMQSAIGPTQQVNVSVDLSNLPPGTRTSATASDGVGFDLNRGFALPGVF